MPTGRHLYGGGGGGETVQMYVLSVCKRICMYIVLKSDIIFWHSFFACFVIEVSGVHAMKFYGVMNAA